MSKHVTTSSGFSAAKIAGVYIGAVVGAGFASGQEIWQFFGRYGAGGFVGLAISGLLFAFFAYAILFAGRYVGARSHVEVVTKIGGPVWGRLMDLFLTVSLPASLVIMLAGAGASVAQQYGIPAVVGSGAMLVATVLTVLMGLKGVAGAISLMAPFFVTMTTVISLLAIRSGSIDWQWALNSVPPKGMWLFSSLAYVAYNVVLSVSILAPMGVETGEKAMSFGALAGGLGLGISAAAVNLGILSQGPAAVGHDVPMLFVATQVLPQIPWLYPLLLLVEIYTTAVASLYGFGARVAGPDGRAFVPTVLLTGGLSLLGAQIGFSRLVAIVYGAMGYVGAVFLLALTVWFVKKAAR